MLIVRNTWEDETLSRTANRFFGDLEHRGFRIAAVYGRYCFHVNVERSPGEVRAPWFHYFASDIYGLCSILDDFGFDGKSRLRITLQTPFSEAEPSNLVEIAKIIRGYDSKQNEVFVCQSKSDGTYFVTMSASNNLEQMATVWP